MWVEHSWYGWTINRNRTFSHLLFDTPFGPALAATTRRGVVRLALPADDPDELIEEVVTRTGFSPADQAPALAGAGSPLDRVADAVDAFLNGGATSIDLPVDWRLATGYTRKVLKATMAIPYGETRSYGEIAIEAGHPGAHRAAGTALSRNPLALVVPCHRVIRADGDPGDYGRGAEGRRLKVALLDLESART